MIYRYDHQVSFPFPSPTRTGSGHAVESFAEARVHKVNDGRRCGGSDISGLLGDSLGYRSETVPETVSLGFVYQTFSADAVPSSSNKYWFVCCSYQRL